MNTDVVLSFIRQALTLAGGILVANGSISADTWAGIVTQLSTMIGAGLALVSIYWSWKTHKDARA
jgi:hypothetical protein